MPEPRTLERGATLDGTYTIDAMIGRGGMGAVYRATHARLPGKLVAIKILHAELDDAEMRERFRREAEIASRLAHPNITEIHDFNVLPDGTPYLVLEYLRGETLSARLRRGPLEQRATLAIVRQIGSALAAAHAAGVVHRDLKPGNVFLVSTQVDGKPTEVAKLLDFGVSKLRGAHTVTSETMMIGTPEYMAPEQARGAPVDHRADVFSFGLIVYEMLGGAPAFAGDSIHQVVYRVVHEAPRPLGELAPGVPREVVAAVERACAKDPDARFASAGDFVEALTGEPITLPKPAASTAFASMPPTLDERRWRADEATSPSPSPSPSPSKPSPRSSSHARRTLAFAIAGLAGAAVIVYAAARLASRDGALAASPGDAATLTAVQPSPDAALAVVAPDAALAVVAPDAAIAVVVRDAATPRTPATPHPRVDAGTSSIGAPTSDPSDVARQLDDAVRALGAGDYDAAEHATTAVLHDQDANDLQRARAHSIHGAVACRSHQNLEGARADLRALGTAYPQLAKRIVNACHAVGFDVDPGDD